MRIMVQVPDIDRFIGLLAERDALSDEIAEIEDLEATFYSAADPEAVEEAGRLLDQRRDVGDLIGDREEVADVIAGIVRDGVPRWVREEIRRAVEEQQGHGAG